MTPESTAARIAFEHGLTLTELRSSRRTPRYVMARAEAMIALRDDGYTLCEIGMVLDRDHKTVLHSLRKYGLAISNDSGHKKRRGPRDKAAPDTSEDAKETLMRKNDTATQTAGQANINA